MLRNFSVLFMLLLAVSFVAQGAPCPPGVHPIVDVVYDYLFGGCVNGKWVDGEKLVKKVVGGEEYRIYSPSAFLGIGRGSKAKMPTEEEGPDYCPSVEISLPKAAKAYSATDAIIGIAGTWNALPRLPRAQNTKQPVYQRVVREWLDTHGLKKSGVQITQIMRIDLDGDGAEEVIICARQPGHEQTEVSVHVGYYSCILLRKMVKGAVRTIPIEEQRIIKNEEWNMPYYHTLASILDVNGDGNMEVITRSQYYEGNTLIIHEIKGTTVTAVLTAGLDI